MTRIAVVGCGAMGSVYAGLLGAAGNEVIAVDVDREHVAAIAASGLEVTGASGERTVRITATADPAEVGPCDLVILATKVRHVGAAAEAARPLLGPETPVLSIQNGLGGPDAAAAVLGNARVVVGVAGGFGASLRGPGRVHHGGMELVRIGEREGPASPRVEAIAELWRAAGFRVQTYDDVGQLVWEKLVCNTTFSGICGVTGRTIGAVLDDPDAWRVATACARETAAVARARDIALSFADVDAYVRAFGERIAGERPSVLLDLMAGRRSEIDAINGAIPAAAATVGLTAPVNATIAALVQARERELGCG